MWIIKNFWSIYLQDNHCWKDLNYHFKKSLIFRIWIKNASKCKSRLKKPQKRSPKRTKTRTRGRHPKGLFGTFGVLISTWKVQNGKKLGPRPKGTWIKLKHIFLNFLEIRMRPSLYSNHLAIFFSLPASINRGCLSKFSTLFHTLRFPSF